MRVYKDLQLLSSSNFSLIQRIILFNCEEVTMKCMRTWYALNLTIGGNNTQSTKWRTQVLTLLVIDTYIGQNV